MIRSVSAVALLLVAAACDRAAESAPAAGPSAAPAAVTAPDAPPAARPAANAPPLGNYVCNHVWWNVGQRRAVFDYKGYFELLPGGTYRWLDDGGTGRYETDAVTGAPTFVSGPLAEKQPRSVTYQMDGTTPEIVLAFEDPVEWQCPLEDADA